jgi:hypothetical protein
MIDGGPFNGGATAKFIINDYVQFLGEVVDGFDSIVCVASLDSVGKLNFQLIHAENRLFVDLLQRSDATKCLTLPLFIICVEDDPPPDASPEPVS